MTYLADHDPESALAPMQAAACTYRIAFGPRAGQKVLSLQTLPTEPPLTPVGCVNAQGFSLHAEVCCAAHERKQAGTPVPLHHPPRHCQRTTDTQSCRRCRAATQEPLPRRDHPHRDVTAGVHAAPGRACPASKVASHPLPWRARAQR